MWIVVGRKRKSKRERTPFRVRCYATSVSYGLYVIRADPKEWLFEYILIGGLIACATSSDRKRPPEDSEKRQGRRGSSQRFILDRSMQFSYAVLRNASLLLSSPSFLFLFFPLFPFVSRPIPPLKARSHVPLREGRAPFSFLSRLFSWTTVTRSVK